MKTMGGFQALNDTDTVLVIKVKSADHTEVRRFYAWLCTGAGAGNGHLIATDLIQLKVIDGLRSYMETVATSSNFQSLEQK